MIEPWMVLVAIVLFVIIYAAVRLATRPRRRNGRTRP
jgi:hypothetical protein